MLACAALACWVQRRALGVYFHPDDLISMEWARGILPAPEFGFWRLLSGRLFFMAALRAFGGNPVPYHVVNLALHVVNVTLVYALARRYGTPRSGALLAAGWFGSARPAFSVLQQAVGVGELLALGLAVSALLACGRSLLRRAAAALLFAAALLSKEIVVLAPLAALIPRQPGSLGDADAWRGRLLDAAPVFVVAVAASAVMALAGAGRHELAGEAYAMRWGPNLFHNLMTYVSWAFDLRNPFFDDPGRISTVAWHAGLPLLAALIALAWLVRRRTTLPLAGLTWAAATLAPVLPLVHHTYANYLYSPLAGIGLALGAGLDAAARSVIERLRSPRAAGGRSPARAKSAWTALALGGLLVASAASSDRLLEARVARRYEDVDLPYDRQLRKSEMVRRAAAGLERTSAAGPRRIALYMPSAADRRLDQRTGRTYSDTAMKLDDMLIVRVLDGGRALRAVVPGLDSVAFVRHWSRDYAGFDLCANSREGDIEDFGRGPDAHLLLGERLIRIGRPAFAVDLLVSACEIYPGDNRLRAMLDQARTAPARR